MNDSVIVVKNLTKIYHLYDKPKDRLKEALNPFKKSYHHDFYALHNINMDIKKGETVGIVGKNGAGKSTLLKIITGVLTPTDGEVLIKGKIASLLELGAGFNPEMTGIENIYLNGTIMGFSKNEMGKKLDAIIAFADIGKFIDQQVKMYSSGMFARLAFSVAINVEPDILIVDEALSVGDAAFQLKCFAKMEHLKAQGTTILFVSHDTYSVRTLCTRAFWIDDGILKLKGTSNDVINAFLIHLNGENETKDNATSNITHPDIKIMINSPEETISIRTGDSLDIIFTVTNCAKIDHKLTYVFNLYRKINNVYVSGTTTHMDKLGTDLLKAGKSKTITLQFPNISLLVGTYSLRLGINDLTGMGILCDLKEALTIDIKDQHEAEGLLSMKHTWNIGE